MENSLEGACEGHGAGRPPQNAAHGRPGVAARPLHRAAAVRQAQSPRGSPARPPISICRSPSAPSTRATSSAAAPSICVSHCRMRGSTRPPTRSSACARPSSSRAACGTSNRGGGSGGGRCCRCCCPRRRCSCCCLARAEGAPAAPSASAASVAAAAAAAARSSCRARSWRCRASSCISIRVRHSAATLRSTSFATVPPSCTPCRVRVGGGLGREGQTAAGLMQAPGHGKKRSSAWQGAWLQVGRACTSRATRPSGKRAPGRSTRPALRGLGG